MILKGQRVLVKGVRAIVIKSTENAKVLNVKILVKFMELEFDQTLKEVDINDINQTCFNYTVGCLKQGPHIKTNCCK